jgi:ribosomal protein S18 acetylase RimI-like enzyme
LAEFVQYDDAKHREQFLDLNIEYMTWIRNEVTERYGRDMFQGRPSVRHYVESVLPKFVEAKPPEGIVYVLEINGVVSGMGALRKLEEGVAEIKRMYILPEHRGHGYGKDMMNKLIDSARQFGYSTLRLDTAEFMTAARHTYESAGFKVRGPYPGFETSSIQPFQIFMEKKL